MVKIIATVLFLLSGLVLISSIQPNLELPLNENIAPKDYQRLMKLQSLGLDFSQHFQNITLNDLDIPSTRIPSKDDLQCLSEMSLWMKGITSGNFWSLKMIDSWGSIPSGILYFNLFDLGNYGECIKISKVISSSHTLKGKYCLAELPLTKLLGVDSGINVKIAVCFPSSCKATHMDTFLNKVIQKVLGVNSKVNMVDPSSCKTNDSKPLDGLTIFTIVLFSLFGCLALLATLYDYFLCQDQKQLPALVKIFSIRATSRTLFRLTMPRSNPNAIDCLHGMRCLSLIWVIFGHVYMLGLASPNINALNLTSWIQKPFAELILHAHYSVDTFFFLSGLLVIMIALRSMDKTKGKLNIPLMYLHRYLRLTPVVAVAILAYWKFLPILVDGPLSDVGDYSMCERTWYLTLLFVQNYATKEICLGHTWYLSVDMQMYIISPIFLFALYKWGKKSAIAMGVLIVLLTVWLFTTIMTTEYSTVRNSADNQQSQRVLYFFTHHHATPWLVGGVFGYFLHLNRGKSFKLNRLTVWAGWILSLALLFTCLFAIYPYYKWSTGRRLSQLDDALYYSLSRIAWPIGLCWVVFACMHGYGGMADSFLSSQLWQPFSKLSYSAYIFHMLIEEINARRVQTSTYFSNYEMMLRFWADFGFTMLVAYLMYITIEAPLGGLEGLLLPNRRPSPKQEISADQQRTTAESVPEIKEKSATELEPDLEAAPESSKPSAAST